MGEKQEKIKKALLEDIKRFYTEDSIFCLTGDLINKGNQTNNEHFAPVKDFLFNRLGDIATLNGKIFMVPGNHDLQRKKIDEVNYEGLISLTNKNPTKLDEFVENNRKTSRFYPQLIDYFDFADTIYDKGEYIKKEVSFLDSSFIITDERGVKYGISCLNSSWLVGGETEKVYLSQAQIDSSLKVIDDAEFKILLTHYPLELLDDFDKHDIKSSIIKKYHLVLTGHTHVGEQLMVGSFISSTFNMTGRNLDMINKYNVGYMPGYNILDVYPKLEVRVYYRAYSPTRSEFVKDTIHGPDDEYATFSFQSNENNDLELYCYQLSQKVVQSKLSSLNSDLITSTSDNGLDSIEKIYVDPKVCNVLESHAKDKDLKVSYYSLKELASSVDNIIIYGIREYGKTILLDNLLINIANNYEAYKIIPVLIKCKQLGKRTVSNFIKEYLMINNDAMHKLLSKGKILLLIDDWEVTDSLTNEILILTRTYPGLRFIGTSLVINDNYYPVSPSKELEVKQLFLHCFSGKQISSLVKKWLANSSDSFTENVQKLIRHFEDLALPRTPLSITLFLLIIKNQEAKPVNIAVLADLYIDQLLQKANFENVVLTKDLDYSNKLRLLAYIAKYMLDNGDSALSYEVSTVDFIHYIENYFKHKYPIDHLKVYNEFLAKGLFMEYDNKIKFRASFLFHYFIAKYMDLDLSFRASVISPENYFKYIEEIQYYSGLKRDQEDILDFVFAQLNAEIGEAVLGLSGFSSEIDENLKAQSSIEILPSDMELPAKPSETEMDSHYDDVVDLLPVQKEIANKNELTERVHIDTLIKFCATVLKHTEDIDDLEKKGSYYSLLIGANTVVLLLNQNYIIQYFNNEERLPDGIPSMYTYGMFLKILPIVYQASLAKWVGTPKLSQVMKSSLNEIKEKYLEGEASALEYFFANYIYADAYKAKSLELSKEFIEVCHHKYAKDLALFKLLTYYFIRSSNADSDSQYRALIVETRMSLGHLSKAKKGEYIQKLKKGKEEEKGFQN